MCQEQCLGKCCWMTGFLISSIMGCFFVMTFSSFISFEFPDSSIFKYDKNDTKILNKEREDYDSISKYPKLMELYNNYTNEIYYNLRYDFSFIHNIIVLPSFTILTIIFAINKNHIIIFYILELISIVLQLIPTALKIDAVKKSNEDNYFYILDFNDYSEEAKKIFQKFDYYKDNNIYIISIIPLVLIFLQFSNLLCFCKCNKESLDTICKKEDDNKIVFILLNIVFGLVSGIINIISPVLYYPCENKYSDYFKLDEYVYSFDRDNGYPFNETNRKVIMDEYFYDDYPVLKKIRNYYYKDNKNEKLELNYSNLGYAYITIIIVSIVVTIISFVLLNILIYEKKYKKAFVIFEVISLLLKASLIFWPFIWLRIKFKTNGITNYNDEIKYLVDDYINYSKCTNTFPYISIMECIYFSIEVIVFVLAVIILEVVEEANNREYFPPLENLGRNPRSHSSQISVNTFNQNNQENQENQENQDKITLKLKDDKNNRYELETDKKSKIKTFLDELKKKYDSLIDKNITSLNIENRVIIINKTNLSKTLEELNLVDFSGFIIINIEEKFKLIPIKKLKFCIFNLDNIERVINIKENNTFATALNNLKNNYDLNDFFFDPIFYYYQNEKIKITKDIAKKEISKLNLPDNSIIYIKINDIKTISIKFIWENNNNKKYAFKAGIKEKFHSVAINFMKTSEEYYDNIIYAFFIKQKNNNKKIIETETVYCFDILEKMDIIKNNEIYFETRKDKSIPLPSEILRFNNENFNKNRYINLRFKNSQTIQVYPLTVDLDEAFEEILYRLKREYNTFRNMRTALYQANNLAAEEKRESKIRYLIKDGQYDILIMI